MQFQAAAPSPRVTYDVNINTGHFRGIGELLDGFGQVKQDRNTSRAHTSAQKR
jgi:hypothetical protein